MEYKVWIDIEQYDEGAEVESEDFDPGFGHTVSLNTLEEAQAFAEALQRHGVNFLAGVIWTSGTPGVYPPRRQPVHPAPVS